MAVSLPGISCANTQRGDCNEIRARRMGDGTVTVTWTFDVHADVGGAKVGRVKYQLSGLDAAAFAPYVPDAALTGADAQIAAGDVE